MIENEQEEGKMETIFDNCNWDRKFESVPESPLKVFRTAEEADKWLAAHREEGVKFYRSLHLFSDSLGQALAVCQNVWE